MQEILLSFSIWSSFSSTYLRFLHYITVVPCPFLFDSLNPRDFLVILHPPFISIHVHTFHPLHFVRTFQIHTFTVLANLSCCSTVPSLSIHSHTVRRTQLHRSRLTESTSAYTASIHSVSFPDRFIPTRHYDVFLHFQTLYITYHTTYPIFLSSSCT